MITKPKKDFNVFVYKYVGWVSAHEVRVPTPSLFRMER